MQIVLWIVALASLIGTILNVLHIRFCFYIWAITNFFWVIHNWNNGEVQQAALSAVYFCLAVWGWISWKRTAGSGVDDETRMGKQ